MGLLPVFSLITYASLLGSANGLQANRSKQADLLKGHPPVPEEPCLHRDKAVDCVNPRDERQCRIGASKRPAITFTFDSHTEWTFNETWYKSMRSIADKMNASLVLLLPAKTAHHEQKKPCSALAILVGACTPSPPLVHMQKAQVKEIQKYFRIVRVPWVVPPNLGKGVPREGGCCGAREFMKLQALSLVEYDAVINLDTDVTIHGSLKPLFDCAASGKFLTARNADSPVSGAFFATKPSKGLLYDMLMELSMSTANETRGWNGRGVAPGLSLNQASFQGFMYYYLHQRGVNQKDITPGQVNPCHWTGAEFCETQACDHLPLRHRLSCPKAPVEFISTEAQMTERIFNNASLITGFVAAEARATDEMEFGPTLSWHEDSESDAVEIVDDEFGPRLAESELAAFLLSNHKQNKTDGNLSSGSNSSNNSSESNTSLSNIFAKDTQLFEVENLAEGELTSLDDGTSASNISSEEDDASLEDDVSVKDLKLFEAENLTDGELTSLDDGSVASESSSEEDDASSEDDVSVKAMEGELVSLEDGSITSETSSKEDDASSENDELTSLDDVSAASEISSEEDDASP